VQTRQLLAEMSTNQQTFQADLEAELQQAHHECIEAATARNEEKQARMAAEVVANDHTRENTKMHKEVAFMQETLVTRLSDAAHKAAQMIEEVEDAAVARLAMVEEKMDAKLEDVAHLEEVAQQLLAMKPSPASQFTVKKLLKQVRAMEKEVTSLRSAVGVRKAAEMSDDSDGEERPRRATSTAKGSGSKSTASSKRTTSKSATSMRKSSLSASSVGSRLGASPGTRATPRSTSRSSLGKPR